MPDPMREPSLRDRAKAGGAVSKWKALQESSARSHSRLQWADCGADDLLATVAAVTEDGAALLLAKTSDGGALVIRVIQDKESVPFYAPEMSILNETLREIQSMTK